jgi:DNA-binding winged helix-turn-helix (wHTH) protein
MSNLPQETLVKFANEIFLPLKNGQCVTCMFVAGGGKRTIINGYICEQTILKNIFKDLYNKTIFVYVDPDEILETSNTHYLELIYNSLKKELEKKKIKSNTNHDHNYLLKIKDTLSEIVNQGWRVVFILNDLEFTMNLSPSIFMNLETIMAIDKSKIVYLFLTTINLLDESILKQLHNLKYAITRNVRYFPLFDKISSASIIDNIAKKFKINSSEKINTLLMDLCGGHPQLLKYATYLLYETADVDTKNIKKVQTYLLSNDRLKIICADIWNCLSIKEKELLNNIVITGNILSSQHEEMKYLFNLGLISKINNKYKVFGQIFEEFIKNKLPITKLKYDQQLDKLYYGNKSCEDKFTYQEFKLLIHFIMHENEIVSRDQVAEVMWGKHLYEEKYSDYSIDKIISTIRKKLDIIGFPSQNLITLKKRGFSFTNP